MIENKNYTVYKHTTPNGKVYIGITSKKPEKRWENGHGYKGNKYFYRAIQKYGWENFKHEIIADGLTKEQACNMEIELIAKYDATNPKHGYNHAIGGEANIPSKETRQLLAVKCSGWKHTDEARRKISEAGKGHIVDEETRKKLSESNKGKHHITEETRQKLVDSHLGHVPWNKGRKLTREQRAKMRKPHNISEEARERMIKPHRGKAPANCKKVLCIETGVIYPSATKAGESVGICQGWLSEACREHKKAGGYHWKYVEEQS